MTLVKFGDTEIVDIETGNSFVFVDDTVEIWIAPYRDEPFSVCRKNATEFWLWLQSDDITFNDDEI